MNPETIDMVTKYLDALSEKLGVGVDYLWPIFVKQQVIYAIEATVAFAIAFPLFLWALLFSATHWRPNDSSSYSIEYSDHEGHWAIMLIVLAVVTFISAGFFFEFFPAFFNPEYLAFKSLIGGFIPE